jgi:molybdopterin-guanine dinucleotide biosynthesis protein A
MVQRSEGPASPASVVIGILAGGQSRRMGRDKALLPAPDTGEALIARLARIGRGFGFDVVAVGGTVDRFGLPRLTDDPANIGPIGGLSALLAYAGDRAAIALACDLPFVEAPLIERLAATPAATPVLSPRDPSSGKWEPLFARYDAPRVLPILRAEIARGVRSFQTFLQALPVAELPLSDGERLQLRDWDEPADVNR